MLTGLTIRDVVLIDRLDLAFGPGLAVLTGETGAGKSILLDALGLALGARADSGLVRNGAKQAVVTASFEVPDGHGSQDILEEMGIDADGPVILRRILTADGRSRAFANDEPVNVATLKRLGETLVEIQGQFDQRGLMDPATHRETLDQFGGHGALLEKVGRTHASWSAARAAHRKAREELERARADEELLRHNVEELDAAAPEEGEETRLASDRTLLANAAQILEAMNGAAGALEAEDGAEQAVATAQRILERVRDRAGDRLDSVIDGLDRAAAEIQEAQHALSQIASDVEADSGRLEEVDDRLHLLRALARKHDIEADRLPELHRALSARLAALDDAGGGLADLAHVEESSRADYIEAGKALTEARCIAAAKLDKALTDELVPLKLDKAQVKTRLEPLDENDWGAAGMERVSFQVSTNPGAPFGPLARIASGGELSRFLLALKVVLSEANPVSTLVFDEVDSGVGGAVAAAVGERLARLGSDTQVLVVTHSPQVAARGLRHWHVAKQADGELVKTAVSQLEQGERREELARMLSGATVTDEARAAADSLLNPA
ncbi:DNA repair protein RecN [Nisaea acidiphila]|uniref:DNA repair protein RecN n=1 Tax=Nisaea acidiphila TaxID=1862145 RepID=A0A9J7AQB2_9PROT|nr:DNA repair protein RecN [Nisaea acidiphila]UUX49082.1 DNA repair protein RecN [Nisaea acidiphila]